MKNRSLYFTYFAALIASIGAFLQCYVVCIIAGALSLIAQEFQMTPVQEGIAASTILIGALAGSGVCGILADRLGRKKSLFIAAFLYVTCSLLFLFVYNLLEFIALRFVTGVAVGMTSILVPLYLAEIAPASKRGAFVTLYQLAVTIGTFFAYFISSIFPQDWRWMLFLGILPAIVQFCGLFFLPETRKSPQLSNGSWQELSCSSYRFALRLGMGLSLIQQFVGINAIILFAPKLFAGVGIDDPMIPTLGLGVVNVMATLGSALLIDRFGRRKLYLLSLAGVGLSLFTMAIASASLAAGMSFFSCVAYIIWFSIGLGPVTWVLISEIYPLAIRAKAISVMTFFNWASAAVVVMLFPSLFAAWGMAGTCSLYALFALGSFFFFFRAIPETKGKSLEELAALLYTRAE